MKAKRVNKSKKATEILKLYQNKYNTTEVPYEEIVKFAKDNNLIGDVAPITTEQQLEADLRRVVKRATWKNPQGKEVRIYGIPRIMFEDEVLTLSPVDMRYAKPDIAEIVQNANFKGIENDVRRHSIETQSYNDNNFFGATLPFYDYNLNHIADEARMTGEYDDSYDEGDFNDIDES